MRLLTTTDGYNVIPDPKIFLILEFETLRDSRPDRNILTKELGYIYFMYNPESDFADQTIESERKKDVIKYLGLPAVYNPDGKMLNCINAYKTLSETSQSKMLAVARHAVDKLKNQIDNIDLDERDPKSNKPIWDLKKYQDIVKGMPDTMESLVKVEELYIKKRDAQARLKGDKEASIFEDMNVDIDEEEFDYDD